MLGLLAVVVMAFAYVVTSRLNAANQRAGLDRAHNAKVLNQAKQALIGWVATNAASTDQNPGRLPCPEAAGYFGDPAQEGIAAPNCAGALPAVGRLPWRTLGLERLVDAAGEPLWYVVSPGWKLPNATDTLVINADSAGQLSLDGSEAVALVVAPGPAMAAQAGTGCAAWTQSRPAAGPPDLRNYLECENATSPADVAFVANRPGQSFNDQVLRVSAADAIPALEAAVAERVQREIAPALRTVYTSAQYAGIPAGEPLFPYAAPFSDPGTSSFVGSAGTYQGLLPVHQNAPSVSGQPRETLGYGYINNITCGTTTTDRTCLGEYHENSSYPWLPIYVELNATFADVATGLRALDASPIGRVTVEAKDSKQTTWVQMVPTNLNISQIRMNSGSNVLADGTTPPRGSVTITFGATLPNIDSMGWGARADFRMRIERAVIADHYLLNPDPDTATNPAGAATSWFFRNQWHRTTYYAVAQQSSPAGLPSLGCDSSNCLRINDAATRNIRALLVLAGRALPGQARPSGILANYVENQNGDGGTLYEQRPVRRITMASNANAPWNDRIVLIDWDAPLQEPIQVIDDNIPAVPVRVATLP